MVRAACTSNIGMRPTHEDNFLLNGHIINEEVQEKMPAIHAVQYQSVCSQKVNIIAVSDGMGGHNAGEVASRYCVQTLARIEKDVQLCEDLESVIDIIQAEINEINHDICRLSKQKTELAGMGATLVVFVSFGSEYAILNIGDSRAYHYDGIEMSQITIDHTEGQRMLNLGILTRKELLDFPARKNLNRYVGYDSPGYVLQADVFRRMFETGIILLCTDGISDNISERAAEEILLGDADIWNASQTLVERAVKSPCSDNATAMLIQLRR